jgi:uncharacterized Tic20 family protein
MTLLSPTRAAVAAHLTPVTAAAAALSRDAFVRAHGRAALRFQLSLALYLAATVTLVHLTSGTVVGVQVVPFALFITLMLLLNWGLFAVVGIHRAATGQLFTYPMTLGRT